MPGNYGLPQGPLSAWLGVRDANQRAGLVDTQNTIGQMGILAKIQAMQQQDQLRGILSSDMPVEAKQKALMSVPGGMGILKQLADMQNTGVRGALDSARIQDLQTKGAISGQEQKAKGMLANLLSPGGSFGQGTEMERPNAQVVPNMTDEQAIELGRRLRDEAKAQGREETPTRINVPNSANVRALAVASGNALPRGGMAEILKQTGAGMAPMTPYQQENLRLRQAQLDKPPASRPLVAMPDPNDPSKAVFGTPQAGQAAFAPGAGGILNSQTIRERQLGNQLGTTIKPHLEVVNAYQRFEEIRSTGDNSQANQFLAEQLKEMAARGTRALPKAELERILGSGDLGNDWIGRASNMITQMAAGVRTPSIDKRLNDLADAMAGASAKRIGQEMQNIRAAAPTGVNLDNITGSKPRIYGRFIITPTGKVHTFANAAQAQAKLQEAAQKVGE